MPLKAHIISPTPEVVSVLRRKVEALQRLKPEVDISPESVEEGAEVLKGVPAVFEANYKGYPITYMLHPERLAEELKRRGDLLVVVADGKDVVAVGMLLLHIKGKHTTLEFGRTAVLPQHQGRGLGSFLVKVRKAAIELLKEAHLLPTISSLYSEPRGINAVTQQNIYKHGGLIPLGVMPKYLIGDLWEHVVTAWRPAGGSTFYIPSIEPFTHLPPTVRDIHLKEAEACPSQPMIVEGFHIGMGNLVIAEGRGRSQTVGRVEDNGMAVTLKLDLSSVTAYKEVLQRLVNGVLKAVKEERFFHAVVIQRGAWRELEEAVKALEGLGLILSSITPALEPCGKYAVHLGRFVNRERPIGDVVYPAIYPEEVEEFLQRVVEAYSLPPQPPTF